MDTNTLLPVILKALTEANICLRPRQLRKVKAETARQYSSHVTVCRKNELEPSSVNRFAVEIAQQVRKGIYEPPSHLTEVNDYGCRKLLDTVFAAGKRRQRLDDWHQQYIQACKTLGVKPYSFWLIQEAVAASATPPTLFNQSFSEQAQRINALVIAYVQQTGRTENPRWYARTTARKKPSKLFNKYAD